MQVLIRIDWSQFEFVANYYPNETVKIVLLNTRTDKNQFTGDVNLISNLLLMPAKSSRLFCFRLFRYSTKHIFTAIKVTQ